MKHIYKELLTLFYMLVFGAVLTVQAEPDPNFHIYLCWGQSNMEGAASVPNSETQGVSDRFQLLYSGDNCSNGSGRKKGQWYTATPPLARCDAGFGPVDYFGRTMVEKLDPSIKVGVVVVAVGGADIALFEKNKYQSYLQSAEQWLKNIANSYGGNPYGRLIDMAKEAQKVGVIKGILVHQGETNTNQSDWPNRLNAVYNEMLKDLGLNASEVPLLVGEVRYSGPCSSHNNVVRKVPNVIPTAHVISADGCEAANDQYHFSVAGYKLLGKRYAETMLKLLGDNPVQKKDISVAAFAKTESEPGEVEISVKLENSDIKDVKIYADDKVISTDKSFVWENVSRGEHQIWAVGYDSNNKEYTSSKVTITIMNPQEPYNGTPFKIPGKIEAEEFDLGGEGNAYHDNDEENRNGGDRKEGIDMNNTAVGYNQVGEWMEYTVDVAEDGDYVVESRVASGGSSGQFTLYMDNQFIIPGDDGTPGGFIDVPNTGDYDVFKTVTTKLNKLTKGKHVLKLEVTGDWFDIDYLEFKLASQQNNDDPNDNPNDNPNQNSNELLTGVTTGKYVDIYVTNRQVSVYAPKNAHANRPLLISCHGMNQDIKYQHEQTKWEEVADTADFIVAYPQSVGTQWDINGTQDTKFLIAIIDELAKTHKIDRTRVYLSGFSMGGMLTYHCMNTIPDYFAAFAPISGYFGTDVNAKTRPVPLIHTHGTGDDVVYYQPNGTWAGAEAVVKNWAKHNNCDVNNTTSKKIDCATQTIYSGGDCEADVVLATVPNRGHIPANDCYHTSREIWRFVSQYSTACGKKKADLSVSATVVEEVAPGKVDVSVKVVNADITKFDLYVDGKVVANGKNSYTADGLEAGKHSIWAVGYDKNNKEFTSNTVEVEIHIPQTPFNGIASAIPGKIEAEEFDLGGEGYAYHDNDEENRNGGDRNEGVDMDNKAIGYTQKGEWLEYTVFVEDEGSYELQANVASGNNTSSFKLYLDDKAITKEISVPKTGEDWSTFELVKADVELPYGEHILKLEVTNDYFDMDYMNFVLKSATGESLIAASEKTLNGVYEVYNALGCRLKNVTIVNGKLNLSNGVYMLKNTATNQVTKIVVTNK